MDLTADEAPREQPERLARVAICDQAPAVPTPYCATTLDGLIRLSETTRLWRPEDFDAASLFAITSQLRTWLARHRPDLHLIWRQAPEPGALRHCFQLARRDGVRAPFALQKEAPEDWITRADFDELRALTADIIAQRPRQVAFFDSHTPVSDSEGAPIPTSWVRTVYPKLSFLPGSRFGETPLAEVPPEGSSSTDRAWEGFSHTTIGTFRDEAARSYLAGIRGLWAAGTVNCSPEEARSFELIPAVTPGQPGVRIGETLTPAVAVAAPGLFSSAEDETRQSCLIPPDELSELLATGELVIPIRNAPFVVWQVARRIPDVTWIQSGLLAAPCESLDQYVGLKNLAFAASGGPDEGFTAHFLFADETTAQLADVLVRQRMPAAETAFCLVDDHRLPWATIAHQAAFPTEAELTDLVAAVEELRARASVASPGRKKAMSP